MYKYKARYALLRTLATASSWIAARFLFFIRKGASSPSESCSLMDGLGLALFFRQH